MMKDKKDKIPRFKISNFTYNLISLQIYEPIKIHPANLTKSQLTKAIHLHAIKVILKVICKDL